MWRMMEVEVMTWEVKHLVRNEQGEDRWGLEIDYAWMHCDQPVEKTEGNDEGKRTLKQQ